MSMGEFTSAAGIVSAWPWLPVIAVAPQDNAGGGGGGAGVGAGGDGVGAGAGGGGVGVGVSGTGAGAGPGAESLPPHALRNRAIAPTPHSSRLTRSGGGGSGRSSDFLVCVIRVPSKVVVLGCVSGPRRSNGKAGELRYMLAAHPKVQRTRPAAACDTAFQALTCRVASLIEPFGRRPEFTLSCHWRLPM
jgi:hypothetical protein